MITMESGEIMTLKSAEAGQYEYVDYDESLLWLEEVEGEKAIHWVKQRNRESLDVLEKDSRYENFFTLTKEILNAKDKIPYGNLRGDTVYNFWKDDIHIRGLWRRTSLEEYRKDEPEWETVLDIDGLAEKEEENWVFKGASVLPPDNQRALIRLSRGGKDAVVVREFDLKTKEFVEDGFFLKEAKSRVSWFDSNTLMVGTDFGGGSLTESGYPRMIRLWHRGESLKDALNIIEVSKKDVGCFAVNHFRPEGGQVLLTRWITFFESENWLLNPEGSKTFIPIPQDAEIVEVFQHHLIVQLKSDWVIEENGQNQHFWQGSLVSIKIDDTKFQDIGNLTRTIYSPNERAAVASVTATRDHLMVSLLDEVKGRILTFHKDEVFQKGLWRWKEVPLPAGGSMSISSSSAYDNRVFANYQSFLKPPSLYLLSAESLKPELLKSLPERFDADPYQVDQNEAVSKDGTRIPYFVIRPKEMKLDGNNPTLLYGYGGFEISLTPSYSATIGKIWLEQGGVYVLANIRGGGEFGPKWHKIAQKKNRQRCYDDFIAVAEDLVKKGISSPKRLGIRGGSNGGLLVGATYTQRPDLFNAVVCAVPLLDMLRYHTLLAGASWVGEYGNPDDPVMREVIMKYSPFQNLKKKQTYPRVFFTTSTKDDRVHPGHARKMAKKMMDFGHSIYYYENIEGGHGGAANNLQRAKITALQYVYLLKQLKD